MSAILKLVTDNCVNNVCLIYNFKQVNDSILVIMYVEKLQAWGKIFLSYDNGAWNTPVLADYTDYETYQQICNKLKFIFFKHEHAGENRALHLEKTMQEDAVFMLGVYT